MTFLQWFLNFLGVVICTHIGPVQSQQLPNVYDGQEAVHIEVEPSDPSSIAYREQKHIILQKLSPEFRMQFQAKRRQAELDYSKGVKVPLAYELPYSTKVLDQGQYGTCVTFATTSAAQAALKLVDVISQQCTLELLQGLGSNLWNGAYYSSEILDPLKAHGAVSKSKCPSAYPNSYASLQPEAYKALVDASIPIQQVQYVYHASLNVEQVKLALNQGHYVSIGFGLLNSGDAISVQGYDVKVNGVSHAGGLWACKQGIFSKNYCGTPQAGHEVVIYGYDESQRLFRIRNSWADKSGFKGDFFMSYEFFSSMNMDGTEIY